MLEAVRIGKPGCLFFLSPAGWGAKDSGSRLANDSDT